MVENKALLVMRIREKAKDLFRDTDTNRGGLCLYHAIAACTALGEAGIKAEIQGGTLNWPIIPPELDDGVRPTHFSYQFNPDNPGNVIMLALEYLPEMHVWNFLPEEGEILDTTTCYLKDEFKRICPHLHWEAPKPPDFLWTNLLPPGVRYRPHPLATKIAHELAQILGFPLSQESRAEDLDMEPLRHKRRNSIHR